MKYIKTKKYDMHLLDSRYDYKRNFSCYIKSLNMNFFLNYRVQLTEPGLTGSSFDYCHHYTTYPEIN